MEDTDLASFMVQGPIENFAENDFTDSDTGQVVTTRTVQFKTKLKNGKYDWIDVKIPPEVDHKQFAKGETWTIPILISSFQGKLFYRANPLLQPQKVE